MIFDESTYLPRVHQPLPVSLDEKSRVLAFFNLPLSVFSRDEYHFIVLHLLLQVPFTYPSLVLPFSRSTQIRQAPLEERRAPGHTMQRMNSLSP